MPERDGDSELGEQSTRLTNDDFRRLLMTPRAGAPSSLPPLSSLLQSAMKDKDSGLSKTSAEDDTDDRAERRRKKKSFYAKLKKQEEDKMAELAQKYRDRARERHTYSNMPERDGDSELGEQSTRLTNDDFRRLLMTPRAGAPSSLPPLSSLLQSAMKDKDSGLSKTSAEDDTDDRAERRRKKKSFYAKLKKQEEDKMAELAQKYRDRARERRDGGQDQPEDPLSAASGYRAVAPDLKSGLDAAERRRQMIQESKFLGGDMEHTHLVKGLDYALLQKVRSEIHSKEAEEDEELERLATVKPVERKEEIKKEVPQDKEMAFKASSCFITKLGRNIFRAAIPSQKIEMNEMFAPGRMAYVIELEGDFAETDIPTTLIRSKADVPSLQTNSTLTTNDIVINKLAQILSYLRQGRHGKKGRRKDKSGKRGGMGDDELNIYPDLAEYEPSTATSHLAAEQRAKKRAPYFSKSEHDIDDGPSVSRSIPNPSALANALAGEGSSSSKGEGLKAKGMLLNRLAAEPEGYAECYPGLEEMQDAIDDSDDEVDYTKMDLGNKKGPVGRWDFDTQEEYSEYMNNKEALPKAAFQYGVKMADGRRTRKFNKEKNEKAELDREWQKIQNIIQKRKGPSTSKDSEPSFKVPRY
ncbi:hypothetical protein FOCC_FOCC009093 [Frankliniella occidentalis]|nr:hypothetical protein FOCC_FOCC009093 [Frankliniella occidentalis]